MVKCFENPNIFKIDNIDFSVMVKLATQASTTMCSTWKMLVTLVGETSAKKNAIVSQLKS